MKQTRTGLAFGVGAYAIWGAFPFYFTAVLVVGPYEVVPWRVFMTFVVCGLMLLVTRNWRDVWAVLKRPKLFALFALASVLLYINWQVFVVSVMAGNVIETSLGYFINPLVTILIGVVVRKERLTRLQWIAVTIAAGGVLAAAVGYGRFPWVAICLALTFATYGAIHQFIGSQVSGITGLTVETIAVAPIAVVQGVVIAATTGLSAFQHGAGITVLVLLSGVMTAVPLVFFGEAARRLPLSYLGFLQFITPIMSFCYGYLVMGEAMSVTRWVGFLAVWIALCLLVTDLVRQNRRQPPEEHLGLHTGPIPLD